tara:strand:+ start:15352 stop:15687 length:336 start_codon:yes stop_codon:yes gene_type:complete
MIAANSAQAADIVCQSSTQLTLQLSGVKSAPFSIEAISLADKTVPNDALLTSVAETSDSVLVEFVNLTTASAFDFEVGKEALSLPSFTLEVFELGSPGSPSQSHLFSCVTK